MVRRSAIPERRSTIPERRSTIPERRSTIPDRRGGNLNGGRLVAISLTDGLLIGTNNNIIIK